MAALFFLDEIGDIPLELQAKLINLFPIALPPLRRCAEDIPMLVAHFVRKYSDRMGKQIGTIASAATDELVRYPWPGNIRELQNLNRARRDPYQE